MLGFPIPYSNELLYSVIARSGVHEGETSPKQLLDAVFSNRKIVATVDLPCHVGNLANQYGESLTLTTKVLIDLHTLWPAYAPFLPYDRRLEVEERMHGESNGTVHLATGAAASRISAKQKLMICECCRDEQTKKYGETYWDRRWQLPIIKYCPRHGPLSETDIILNRAHRHQFVAASQSSVIDKVIATKSDIRFSELSYELFDSVNNLSPSYMQWSCFYHNLAIDNGFIVGKRLDHDHLYDEYMSYWGERWLSRTNLLPSTKDSSWLKTIFRKHRKAFSFAEHLTVIDAISSQRTEVTGAIKQALQFKARPMKPDVKIHFDSRKKNKDQSDWLELLQANGPKAARKIQPALYARLYRNHHHWLMSVNNQHRLPACNANSRIDWGKRDRQVSQELLGFVRKAKKEWVMPRLSKTFLINQIANRSTVEKNLYRLPRCSAILDLHSESIGEYQVRRLKRVVAGYTAREKELKEWVLLREAGLSESRITSIAKKFLKEALSNVSSR